MAYCVYDNPETMRREHWLDGKLSASYAFEELLRIHWWLGREKPHKWELGKVIGNKDALPRKPQWTH